MASGDTTTRDSTPREHHRTHERIGPYTLLEPLGEGGFGIVYLAERREPFTQRVALKVVRPGMDSREILARFSQERQALAVMDHPNVARVLDGGVTPPEQGSRPYFVMEYVKGESITAYCDRNRLGLKERLELMILVCEAVQHAHHKGIIHRDIKPSNVLVTILEGRPTPKVIDFGVAKALSHTLTQHTLFTEHGKLIGTPEYMSPEQAEMGATDVDTRTDVYSLGVLLYELLSGTLPFERDTLRNAAYDEVRRIIREQEPPRPSTRLTTLDNEQAQKLAQQRQMERDAWTRTLKQELEWIPLKAIRKDRARRYATPAALAEDIKNYLDGKPIDAAPESRTYLLKKFVSRNRGLISACSFVLVAWILAAIAIGVFASRWHDERNEARKAANREADARRIAEESLLIINEEQERQRRLSNLLQLFGSAHAQFSAALYAEDDSDLSDWETLVEQLDSGVLRDQPRAEIAVRDSLAQVLLDDLSNNSDEAIAEPDEAVALLEPALRIADATFGPNDPATLNIVRHLRTAVIESIYWDYGDEESMDDVLALMDRECTAALGADGRSAAAYRIIAGALSELEEYELAIDTSGAMHTLDKWIAIAQKNWVPIGEAEQKEFSALVASISVHAEWLSLAAENTESAEEKKQLAEFSERWRESARRMNPHNAEPSAVTPQPTN